LYAIKMGTDKSLTTTIHSTIYQGEKNADTLVFIVPKYFEEKNIADCDMLLRYILPNGCGKSEGLIMDAEPYNKDYYKFHLSVETRFTKVPGNIEVWLTAIDMYDNVVVKSGTTMVPITESKDITDFLCDKDPDQLKSLEARMIDLETKKADDIIYSSEEQYLQLSAQGAPIGSKVNLSSMENNDDVIDFDDESLDGSGSGGSGEDSSGGGSGGDTGDTGNTGGSGGSSSGGSTGDSDDVIHF